MFEKIMQTTQKTIQHIVQLNTTNIQKTLTHRRWKTIAKGSGKRAPRGVPSFQTLAGLGGGGGHGGHDDLLYLIRNIKLSGYYVQSK